MKDRIAIVLILALPLWLFAQPPASSVEDFIDNLKNELEVNDVDSVRAVIQMFLAESYQTKNPDSTIYYGEKAIELAKKIDNVLIEVGATGFLGGAYVHKGNLPKALELGLYAIELGVDLPPHLHGGIGPTYFNLGEIYTILEDYQQALYHFKKMVDFGEEDVMGVAFGYLKMANVYEKMNLLDSSLFMLTHSYNTFNKMNYSLYPNVYPANPRWYNIRARVYLKQGKPNLALKDLFTTLHMTLENNEPFYSSNSYNDIARFYKKRNLPDSAIYYAEKGLAEANKISYIQGILTASELLSNLFESKDDSRALQYLKLANETRNQLYGAGNIQVISDMIAQSETKQQELALAETAYRNRLRINALLGSTFTLVVIAFLFYRNGRSKQKAKKNIEKAYDQLKTTQSQLIQSEKMASLGELTAGIAHEIQNPLNFVNNFSEINRELIEELKNAMASNDQKEIQLIFKDLAENEEKIKHHGQRAEGIVKSMLQHSRSSTGEREYTDINALCDEYLRLAYHGFRAKDKSFNAEFKTELDPNLPKIEVVPQEIGRVLLNLINNAFQAVYTKDSTKVDSDYKPFITVSTERINNHLEIHVNDNGPGMPEGIKDKIFQPFFTTKPAGQGTGLGLSLSYDIIKAHGGELMVETNEEKGSDFIIQLPY